MLDKKNIKKEMQEYYSHFDKTEFLKWFDKKGSELEDKLLGIISDLQDEFMKKLSVSISNNLSKDAKELAELNCRY
ncbi:TPA: hypothetical protein ACN35C_004744 [Vibrio parahaemolyticus]